MARVKFTAGKIKNFECPEDKKQVFFWDSEEPGLGIRCTPTAKVYIFQGKLNGKSIRVKIGDVRTWVIDDPTGKKGARQEASRLKALIDKGIDPRLVKKSRIDAQGRKREKLKRQEITLGEVWPLYLEDRKPKWSERHYLDHVRMAAPGGEKKKRGKGLTRAGALAPLLNLRLSDLIPETIEAWAAKQVVTRGRQTALTFDALRAFINWCQYKPEYKNLASPDACSTWIKREILPQKKAKHDCLQREQLSAWFEAIQGLSNPVISAYLQGLLLTGARREELAALKWSDIDFKWQALIIHDKVEGERIIPLTPYISYLLNSLPRRNEWVFSSPAAASGRLQEPRKPHNRALKVAGIEGLTLHGLRRSFGTLSEWVEAPAGVAAQLMGHKPSATAEKHYRERPLDLLRLWHVKVESWILEQAGIEIPKAEKVIRRVK